MARTNVVIGGDFNFDFTTNNCRQQWRHSLLTGLDKVQGPQGSRGPEQFYTFKKTHTIMTCMKEVFHDI